MKANCEFVSIWDGGVELRSPAFFDRKDGSVTVLKAQSGDGVEHLDREFIELPNGDELEVCLTCHESVMKTITDLSSKTLEIEGAACSNTECESNHL